MSSLKHASAHSPEGLGALASLLAACCGLRHVHAVGLHNSVHGSNCLVISVMQSFNAVIAKMVMAVLWVSPFGIASLIAASICRACDLAATVSGLSLWMATVLLGLALHGLLLLPAMLLAVRSSPLRVLRGFSEVSCGNNAKWPLSDLSRQRLQYCLCFAGQHVMG